MATTNEYTYKSDLEAVTNRTRLGITVTKAAFLEWLSMEDRIRQEKYKGYREYYDGDQDTMLTDRMKVFLELSDHHEFTANVCALVCDELERRMTVATFDAEGNRKLGGHKGILWRWWRKDKMDAEQSDTHLSAIRDGDSYVIVSWNQVEGLPEFHHNLAYDGVEGVKTHYSDETGKIAYATKRWLVTDPMDPGAGVVKRMNLYYPDRIERYIADGKNDGKWRLFSADGQDAVIPWVDPVSGAPLGVPVFHLKYKPAGYRWGTSILDGVIPLQNGLNKAILDVISAADTTGFRVYWATGTDMTDADGNPLEFHPGTIITTSSPDAKFGYAPGEDLRPLIEVVDMFKVTIAQVSETPLHLFQVSGQNASEGAQKQQEVGMINKAEKWGRSVGNFWEDCMQMAIRLSNAFDGSSYPTDLIIQTIWEDAEVRDKTQRRKDKADTAKVLVDAGASIESAAIQSGYTEEQAKELAKMAIPKLALAIAPGSKPTESANAKE